MSMRDLWIPAHSNKTHNQGNTQRIKDETQTSENSQFLWVVVKYGVWRGIMQ